MTSAGAKRFGWVARAVVVVALLGGVVGIGVLVVPGPTPIPPPLPVPNAYDVLLRAGRMVAGQAPDVAKASAEELRAFVEPNRAALELARPMIVREGRVPLAYTEESLAASLGHLGAFRRLGHLFAATAALAETKGRRSEALGDYMNAVSLGQRSAFGGHSIHASTGLAIQAQGLAGLEGIIPSLGPDECRWLIATMAMVESHQDASASVIARERAWYRASADWRTRMAHRLHAKTLEALRQPGDRALEAASKRTLLRMRLIRALAAVRLYRLEHGDAEPPGLAALVPNYLPAVPRDPSGGRPLLYRDEPGEGVRIDPGEAVDAAAR